MLYVILLSLLLAGCTAQPTTYAYEQFPTGCYKFHSEKALWGSAWQICREEGGYLGIINNDDEAFVYSGLFARITDDSKWCSVGFHDYFVEGHYVTIFGDDLTETGYTTWAAGEPNNGERNEDCGSITHGGLLNDMDCEDTAPFICEIDVVEGVTCPTAP